MAKHSKRCVEKSAAPLSASDASAKGNIFLLEITSGKDFWLFIEINDSSTLEDIDLFLRDTWLECCGHMSQFTLSGEDYPSNGGMAKKLRALFRVGTVFDYEYDFGTTTELHGKVISVRQGKLKETVRLVARNYLPDDLLCTTCQKKPDVICSVCYEFYCKKCKKKHGIQCEGEDMLLPVVNSPRMGVCGYTGPDSE
jgi:hypothetical protein